MNEAGKKERWTKMNQHDDQDPGDRYPMSGREQCGVAISCGMILLAYCGGVFATVTSSADFGFCMAVLGASGVVGVFVSIVSGSGSGSGDS